MIFWGWLKWTEGRNSVSLVRKTAATHLLYQKQENGLMNSSIEFFQMSFQEWILPRSLLLCLVSKINVERLWNCRTQFFDIYSPSFQISLYSRFTCSKVRSGSGSESSDPSQLWLSRILLQRLQTQWFPAWVFLAVNLNLYPTINAWMRLLSTACPSQTWKKSTFDFRGCQITLTFHKKSQNLESVSWWHQFHQIKRKYCFTKVSYKFLLQTNLIFLQNMAGEVLLKLRKTPR